MLISHIYKRQANVAVPGQPHSCLPTPLWLSLTPYVCMHTTQHALYQGSTKMKDKLCRVGVLRWEGVGDNAPVNFFPTKITSVAGNRH